MAKKLATRVSAIFLWSKNKYNTLRKNNT